MDEFGRREGWSFGRENHKWEKDISLFQECVTMRRWQILSEGIPLDNLPLLIFSLC